MRTPQVSMARKTRAVAHGIELYDLTVFQVVARLGSIGAAARALGTVQPAVSTRIQGLEAELGTQLLDRHSWGVSLTKAGERLLPYAKRISHLVDLARDTVRQDEDDICRLAAAEKSPTPDHHNARLPERPVDQACIAVATAEPQSETPG
jgi:DNA-binding transcriptional LysR family regulator